MTTLNTLMIDYQPTDADHVGATEFVNLAREVLATRNAGNFADNWLEIRTNYNGLDLQVSRLRQFVPLEREDVKHLAVDNPVSMVNNGEPIRHHGEHIYLTQRLRDLIAAAKPADPAPDADA